MAKEELAELIVKLCKLGRNKNGSDIDKVSEEMADVELMLEQLKYIFKNDLISQISNPCMNKCYGRI